MDELQVGDHVVSRGTNPTKRRWPIYVVNEVVEEGDQDSARIVSISTVVLGTKQPWLVDLCWRADQLERVPDMVVIARIAADTRSPNPV